MSAVINCKWAEAESGCSGMPSRHLGLSPPSTIKGCWAFDFATMGERGRKNMLVSTEAPYVKCFDEKESEGLITHRGCELWFKVVKQTAVGSGWQERRVNGLCYRAFSPGGVQCGRVYPQPVAPHPSPPLFATPRLVGGGGVGQEVAGQSAFSFWILSQWKPQPKPATPDLFCTPFPRQSQAIHVDSHVQQSKGRWPRVLYVNSDVLGVWLSSLGSVHLGEALLTYSAFVRLNEEGTDVMQIH